MSETTEERLTRLIRALADKGIIDAADFKEQKSIIVKPDPIRDQEFGELLEILGIDEELSLEEMEEAAEKYVEVFGRTPIATVRGQRKLRLMMQR